MGGGDNRLIEANIDSQIDSVIYDKNKKAHIIMGLIVMLGGAEWIQTLNGLSICNVLNSCD